MRVINVIAVILIIVGSVIIAANWWNILRSYQERKFHSSVPFIGAMLFGLGIFFIPRFRLYCWVPFILDYGTIAFLFALPRLAREFWITSHFNLLSEYFGESSDKRGRIRLFRNGIFSIRIDLLENIRTNGVLKVGHIGTWRVQHNQLIFDIKQRSESAIFDLINAEATQKLKQSVGFPSWERIEGLSLKDTEFLLIEGRRQERHD